MMIIKLYQIINTMISMKKFLILKNPGVLFNRQNIMDSMRELYMLGFFGDVVPLVSEVKNRNEIDKFYNKYFLFRAEY